MFKLSISVVALFSFCVLHAQQKILAKNPEVITGHLIKVTKPLREFTLADKSIPDVIVRDLDGIIGKDEAFEEGVDKLRYPSAVKFVEDPALQKNHPNNPHNAALNRAIVQNFAGIGYQPLNPPDPTLCVGPNHVIQMINGSSGALFKVYNKTGGQVVATTYLDAITGKGGLGDPIAIYDQLADRFILTEFNNKPETGNKEGLTLAVSQTGDPAGAWFVYFFSTGNTFPDYPKFSVWTDAYYATTNDFANGTSYAGSSVYAFDKAKMIAGNATATVQKFTIGNTDKFFSMTPVNLEGTTLPPAGTGGLIAYMLDDTWTATTADRDSIGLIEFKVNFTTPSSTMVIQTSSLATAAFKSDICTTTRGQCISQPGSTVAVEDLDGRIMNQPIYRRFAGYEGIVMTHVVDKGSSIAGARWYELRKTIGNWSINQQSTYAPDNTHRWMSAICYDKNGNIGLAYNVSSKATGVFPGARYTGRKECDPLNTMAYSEDVIIAGTAANSSTRYGDYNHLVCDPDGVTFWFTCEYNVASTWSTRIASFTLDPCTATCVTPGGLASSAITNTSASVSWTAVAGAVSYDVYYKLNTSATWVNAATATATTSVNLSLLTAGSLYDWRVRTNCASGNSTYASAQFTTTSPCPIPAGLASSAITNTSATVAWAAAGGAVSYDVDYKLNTSATWVNAATATATTSVNLSSLTPGSLYDWRVRTNCASGSSAYASAQVTTTLPCPVLAGLVSSAITGNSATIAWTAPSGAVSYDVDYKLNTSGTWINAATATAATSVNLSSLAPGSLYDWQVRTNCSGSSSGYSAAQFTTSAAGCTDQFEPNNSKIAAAPISVGNTYNAQIATSGDRDYYSFNNTAAQMKIRISLTNLPANYNMKLYKPDGNLQATAQNTGTASEKILYNPTTAVNVGTYILHVYGFTTTDFSSTQCYTLLVELSATNFTSGPSTDQVTVLRQGLKVHPNPAYSSVTVEFDAYQKGTAEISIADQLGQIVFSKSVQVSDGINVNSLNISNLRAGAYIIKVNNGREIQTQKLIIEK